VKTLTHYEVAWNMYRAGSTIDQIKIVVSKDRSTVYRWIQRIKRLGIRRFLERKESSMVRRSKARIPEYVVQMIIDVRNQFSWCGQKIRKELKGIYGIAVGLSTVYRYLHKSFTKAAVGVRRYKKHKALVTATSPREVIEHDTVDLGGGVYAYTAIDIFTKEPSIYIGTDLTMETGAAAFALHNAYYGKTALHQSDNGSEFQTTFREAVLATGSEHRYSRPYKKNEQSHIENFNKATRSECFPRGEYNQRDIEPLQQQANTYTTHYITRRWHMGLPDMMTPAQFKDFYSTDPVNATLQLSEIYAVSHLG
jgi:transposase InsO family protein